MKKLTLFLIPVVLISLNCCTTSEILETVNTVSGGSGGGNPLTSGDVAGGLKEALVIGAKKSATNASKMDGYFKNTNIKIPFPPEVKKVEDKLRSIGLGKEVDKFVLSLNRGAEAAAKESAPIFVDAITSMSIQDAWGILKGGNNAATNYLKEKTTTQLMDKFQPVIQKALGNTNATKYYTDLINTYNKIPLVQKVDPDLEGYATQKAIDGLFFLVEKEEKKIRVNPIERTTDLLKRVFAEQD